jgi:hypothetical protein
MGRVRLMLKKPIAKRIILGLLLIGSLGLHQLTPSSEVRLHD